MEITMEKNYYYCDYKKELLFISDTPITDRIELSKINQIQFDNYDAMGFKICIDIPKHKYYAGIGARNTPEHILFLMHIVGAALASDGYTCKTGAAKGADQAFAEGASLGGGRVDLSLPWGPYEKDWISSICKNTTIVNVLPNYCPEAIASVTKYHPNPAQLKQAVVKLHARNWMIMQGVEFVVCWTQDGEVTGGTGQALRLAEDKGITVYNLGNPVTYKAFVDKLISRGFLDTEGVAI